MLPSHLIIILTLVYVVFGLLAWHLFGLFVDRRLDQRLEMIRGDVPDDVLGADRVQFKGILERFLAPFVKWSIPSSEEETSKIRIKLSQGGYRSNTAVVMFYGMKSLLPLIFVVPFIVIVLAVDDNLTWNNFALITLVLLTVGYYLPDYYLQKKVEARQREIFENFPDAMDLIRVCVTAGLGLDSAIARVGQLIGGQSKVLAQDFRLLSLELRAGVPKEKALRGLALRTGLEEVNSLVAMLIQSEKFGTSVSESLKVHSEGLRTKRKRMAQEAAAKVPVKLTIPMMICILPALFVVVLGPAILDIMGAF